MDTAEKRPDATSHRVHLFYDFTFKGPIAERLTGLRLKQAASPEWVHPDRLAPQATRPIGDAAVWEWASWSLSPDLHPTMRQVLDSHRTETAEGRPPHCMRWSRNAAALAAGRYRLAPDQREAETGMVLALRCSPRLAKLANAGPLLIDGTEAGLCVPVTIEEVTLHAFETDVGLVVVSLRLLGRQPGMQIPPDLLVELVPRLGDERRGPAFGWRDGWNAPGAPRFAIGDLVRRMVEPAGCRIVARHRIYSYCAVVAGAAMPEADMRDLAFRLSRHYSAVYHPHGDLPGTIFAQPFQTVLHAASREGGCTVVVPIPSGADEPVEFLEEWLVQAHTHVYLPLQIAAFHEYVALLGMAQGAGQHIDIASRDHATVAALRELSHRFLLFRLRYRLLQVSVVTVHEMAWAATTEALGIEALSTKIARDLVEVERHLLEVIEDERLELARRELVVERRRERSTAWFAGVVGGAIAYITMASLADHLSEFVREGLPFAGLPEAMRDRATLDRAATAVKLGCQGLGLLLAFFGAFYALRSQRSGHDEREHIEEHEMMEIRLARHEAAPTQTQAHR